MKLKTIASVVDFGHWARERGFTVAEGPGPYGPVHQVHSSTSLHYEQRALDINHNERTPRDARRWQNEDEALRWLYRRVLRFRRRRARFPLDEMWYDRLGFMKEYGPDVNHPIEGHESHLHIGFTRKTW